MMILQQRAFLKKTELKATKSLNMVVGREENIEVTMPAVVKEANPSVAYVTDNKDIATVDENWKVTDNRSRNNKDHNKGYAWQYDERSCD